MEQNKALTIVREHEQKKDLVFVKPEDLQTQKMFIPQVTVLHATREDFHDIKGKMMPKSHHTDRIGEAAGISFIAENCSVTKIDKYVWVGRAQGRRRQPDGTWRTSTVQEYEFDAELRAEQDAKGDKKKERSVLLDYAKFGRQRAASGARMRVVRELVGIPTTFGPQDIGRAMVVSRIAINTDEMLDSPEMRQAAIQHAVGGTDRLFGPKDVTPQRESLPQPEGETTTEAPEEDDWGETADADEDPLEKARFDLEEWLLSDVIASSQKATEEIRELLAREDATLEEMQDMIDRCVAYQQKKEEGKAS